MSKPYAKKLSEKVTGYIHRDGHVEIGVKLPWPIGEQMLRLEADELDLALAFLREAIVYRDSLTVPRRK